MSVVVVILVISFTIHFLFGTINPFYVVVSGSMIPNLNIGDLLAIDHNYNYNSLKVGDIIVFNTPGVNNKGAAFDHSSQGCRNYHSSHYQKR